jgi:hypothetical protein
MFKKIVLLSLVIWFSGCAAPEKTPILITHPNGASERFQINQASAAERLELAKFECRKLDDTLEAVLVTKDIEREYMKDQADKFSCQKVPQKTFSPLELRVLQSRIFKTTTSNLIDAINTFMRDSSGSCWNKSQLTFGATVQRNGGNSEVEVNEVECRSRNKQFNVELDQISSGVLTRARIYASGQMGQPVQISDPKEYSYFFKQIADQLFVEAIQINPAEIR